MKTSICSAKNLLAIGLAIVLGIVIQSCGRTDEPEIVTPPDNGEGDISECPGALSGVFTVGNGADGVAGTDDDVKVRFSKGNLYAKYEDGKWTWNFYNEQYGYNSLNSECKDGSREAKESDTEIDLFYWGLNSTSLNPIGEGYVAAHTKEFEELVHDKPSSTGGDDWGVAYCESNNIAVGTWRTLSIAEWEYLFKNHDNTWATVHGVTGYIFAPDNFAGTLADSYADDDALETDNLIFLPAAGWRGDCDVLNVGENGHYWSSSADTYDCAYLLSFAGDEIYVASTGREFNGLSIRLVMECQ